ncbi:MAG: hypothetical protein J6A88_01065 [Oscillospiraceae bacterium]|nr:hypothetical protein [Oscillospiraceae bacterium]
MESWNVVYSHKIACTEKQGFANGGVDPEYACAQKIAQRLGEAQVVSDLEHNDREVLIGFVDRPEMNIYLGKLMKNQYGVCRIGNKILVSGHCVASVIMACNVLLEQNPVDITDGYDYRGMCQQWITDIPAYPGLYLGMTDCCFDNVEFVYESDLQTFDTYLSALAEKGYQKTFENTICDNRFTRWIKDGAFLSVSYSPSENRVRLISGSLQNNKFFDTFGSYNSTEIIAQVNMTQMMLDYDGGSFGMCYIITLEDGSFVIFDGGHVRVINGYPKTYDYVRLYTLLEELNTRPDGKIVISAWYMTHEHSDHFNVFYWFCKAFGDKVTIKAYGACPCSNTVAYNAKNPEFHTVNGRLAQASEWAGGFDLVTLQTGDDFTLGGVHFEILYTVDDIFPDRLHYFNDSSFVCKMTYGGQATLWLGDICTAPSEMLIQRYAKDYLKCDIVQMAHHGLNGARWDLYEAVDAKVLLWSLWEKLAVKQLDDDADLSVEHIGIARRLLLKENPPECYYHKRPNYTFTLPYSGKEGERVDR